MDKNTITGLILMGLVFFGFIWLTPREKPEEPTPQQQEQTATAPSALGADSLTATEKEWLVKNINEQGETRVLADSTHVATLAQDNINLTACGDSVWGTVTVDGATLNWADVTANNLKAMSSQQQRKAIETVRNVSLSMGRYGKFSRFLTGEEKTEVLENNVLKLNLSSKSGSITRAELKKYDTEYTRDENAKQKRKVVIFENGSNTFDFQLPLPQSVTTSQLYFNPQRLNDSTVLMALNMSPDAYWGLEYTLPKGDSYVVRIRVVQRNMADLVESNVRTLGVNWQQQIKRQERGRMFEERNSGLYYKFAGGSVENLSENKNESEERKAKIKWIGFKNQFFSSVLVAGGSRSFNMADFESTVLKNSDYLKEVSTTAQVNDYDWKAENPVNFDLFIGPNLYPLLSHLDKDIDAGEDLKLTRLIPLGWSVFRWINTGVVIPVFNFLGSFISNYGIIILLLTIFIKLVLFPLTYKSYKSQAKMRILAPDIKALNEKYPGNENAMIRQQKTMALYSKAGASPMSGCLPMLLQMPILFAMFTFFPSCIELPLGSRPLGSRCHHLLERQHSSGDRIFRQPHLPVLPPDDGDQHRLHLHQHAEPAGADARHEVDDVYDAGDVYDFLQQLCRRPIVLLLPLVAYHHHPDLRLPLHHQGGGRETHDG
mgnify:CR=1 FL=1